MLISAMKDYINKLPSGDFTKVWTAIEKVEAAVTEAGPLGIVVLEYARLKEAGRNAHRLASLVDSVARMQNVLDADRHNIEAARLREERLAAELGKAQKRIAKLKKKSK